MIHKSKSYARLPRPAPLAPQSGLSLVELIISLALGLIITLGVTQIYLSGNDTYRQTQGLAHAQESTRLNHLCPLWVRRDPCIWTPHKVRHTKSGT